MKNIERPDKSIINTQLDTSLLYNVWTKDTAAPSADFEFSSKAFDVAEYDGNSAMPYILNGNQLKVYYNDFIQDGVITYLDKRCLKIKWKGHDDETTYVRWNNQE